MKILPKMCSLWCTTIDRAEFYQYCFLFFINDIAKCPVCAKCVLYVDKTNISSYIESFTSKRLTVNINKTLYVLFHRKNIKATRSLRIP